MKILLFGPSGGGKTTWAKHLSQKFDLPLFHIDRYFFNPDWTKRPFEDFMANVDVHIELPRWIIDGNGMRSLETRYKESIVAILLHPPLLVCFSRIIYRWLSTLGKIKPDGPEGAKNGITWCMLIYIWNFEKRYTVSLEELREKYPHIPFYEVIPFSL
jgi:adenylate kinase family enzyme